MRFNKCIYKGTAEWVQVINGDIPVPRTYIRHEQYVGMASSTNTPVMISMAVYSTSTNERKLYFTCYNKPSSNISLPDISFAYPVLSL